MRRFCGRPVGDEGASLILVLVFIASFGLIVPALLTTADTSVRTISTTRDIGARASDANAAAETAVNAVRNSVYDNAPGQPCFHDPLDVAGANDSSALTVTEPNTGQRALATCQADPDTGQPTTVKSTIVVPTTALLTTGTGAGGEVGIEQTSNNVLRVSGRVYSNSTIKVDNNGGKAELHSTSDIRALDACSGPITSDKSVACSQKPSTDPLYTAPSYSLPSTVPAAPVSIPTCTSTNTSKTYTMFPGTYTDANALTSLTKGCGNSLVWFQPGTYYFDFAPSNSRWDITGGYVVGGTPTGSAFPSPPPNPPTIPGSCVEPKSVAGDNGGVLFIFGGASRVSLSGSGQMELCGKYDAGRPSIAMFGATTGSGTSTGNVTLKTDGTGRQNGSDATFSPYVNIKDKDFSTADAVLSDKNKATTATVKVTLSGSVPTGATLTSATLRIAHRDLTGPPVTTGNNTVPAGPITGLSATIRPLSGTSPDISPDVGSAPLVITPDTATTSPPSSTNVHEESLDFTNGLRSSFNSGFTGISATYSASNALNTSSKEQLDSIQLDLVYTVPGFRAQSSSYCTGQTPYLPTTSDNGTNTGGPCAMVATTGQSSRFYVEGTTYAPLAALNINLNAITQQVFGYGLVCRALVVSITGSASYTAPVFSVPETMKAYSDYRDLVVYLHVYLCESNSCPDAPTPAPPGYVPAAGSGWVRRLSAQVTYHDPVYPPVSGARGVNVLSWSHIR